MKRTLQTCLGLFLAAATLVSWADERTGREFSEIVRDLNRELAEAKVQVRKIEEDHQNKQQPLSKEALPERAEALNELKSLTKQLKKEKQPAQRQEMESRVQEQVIKVAELSADFLEGNKNDLLNQDRQLGVMEKALANVIMKLDRLETITAENKAKTDEEIRAEKVVARKELQSMARMVEMFAKESPKSRHWKSVRQTILLQDAILRRTMTDNSKLHNMLAAQKQVYEQTHAQIVLARQGITEEKKLLGQIALGEVARSMLRKAAGILLGDSSIEKVGFSALAQSETRQKNLMSFLSQDQDADPAFNPAAEEVSDELSDDYSSFLNAEIN